MATGGINVQVTIDAQDRGAAQKLLDLKRAAGELGVAFNATTKEAGALGATAAGLGGLKAGFAGLTGEILKLAAAYVSVREVAEAVGKGFTATSTLEQARLGIAAEIAAAATIRDASGRALEGPAKLAAATAEADKQMQALRADAERVGIEATTLADIFTKAVAPALRGGGNLDDLRKETPEIAILGRTLGVPYERIATTLLQILNGHVQQRNQIVAILGIQNAELATAKERGTIQDLLNEKLAVYAATGGAAANTLRGISGRLKVALEEGAIDAVAPIVEMIEQRIGPQLGRIDLSGLSSAIRTVASEAGTLLGDAFTKVVIEAEALSTWLVLHKKEVDEVVTSVGKLVEDFVALAGKAVDIGASIAAWAVDSGLANTALTAVSGTITTIKNTAHDIVLAWKDFNSVDTTPLLDRLTNIRDVVDGIKTLAAGAAYALGTLAQWERKGSEAAAAAQRGPVLTPDYLEGIRPYLARFGLVSGTPPVGEIVGNLGAMFRPPTAGLTDITQGPGTNRIKTTGLAALPTITGNPPPDEEAEKRAAEKAARERKEIAEAELRDNAKRLEEERRAAEDEHKLGITDTEAYYARLVQIDTDSINREIVIKRGLFNASTDRTERLNLIPEIEGLYNQLHADTLDYAAKEIESLREVEKARVAAARGEISTGREDATAALGARSDRVRTEVATGSITKAEGAAQLGAAYAEALTKLRDLYNQASLLAALTQDPKDITAVDELAKAYGEVQLEAAKAASASNEFAKSLGEALGSAFDKAFGGGLDQFRSFSKALREEAISLAKDLQKALAQPIGKAISESVRGFVSNAVNPPQKTAGLGTPEAATAAGAAGAIGAAGGPVAGAAAAGDYSFLGFLRSAFAPKPAGAASLQTAAQLLSATAKELTSAATGLHADAQPLQTSAQELGVAAKDISSANAPVRSAAESLHMAGDRLQAAAKDLTAAAQKLGSAGGPTGPGSGLVGGMASPSSFLGLTSLTGGAAAAAPGLGSIVTDMLPIAAASGGGYVRGAGSGTSDSITARLSHGEHIMPAHVVAQPGMLAHLETIRTGGYARAPGYAAGGGVGRMPSIRGSEHIGTLNVELGKGLQGEYIRSAEGERDVISVMVKHRDSMLRAGGQR